MILLPRGLRKSVVNQECTNTLVIKTIGVGFGEGVGGFGVSITTVCVTILFAIMNSALLNK